MDTNSLYICAHNVVDVDTTNDLIKAVREEIDAKIDLYLPEQTFCKGLAFGRRIFNNSDVWVGSFVASFDNEDGQDSHIYSAAACIRLDDERLFIASGDNDSLKISLGSDYKIELLLSADDPKIHKSARVHVYHVAVKAALKWYNEQLPKWYPHQYTKNDLTTVPSHESTSQTP